MALDEIAEVVVKAVGQFLIEIVFVGVFYWPGLLILRTLTLGRYPPKKPEPHSEICCSIWVRCNLSGSSANRPGRRSLMCAASNSQFDTDAVGAGQSGR